MVLDMLEYYNMLRDNHLNIIYSGPLWSEGIEGIAGTLKKRLEFDELPLPASQAVFSVFVEQVNNMLMYSAEKERFEECGGGMADVSKGIFILGTHGKTYFLQSGNTMRSDRTESIKDRIDYLNTLDKKQLRKFYKEQIKKENENTESRGAGLGLIEIARRASSKIEYKFTPLEQGMTFFAMYVEIG